MRAEGWPLTLPVPGLHMLYNALAATAGGRLYSGWHPPMTAAALDRFRHPPALPGGNPEFRGEPDQ